MGTALLRPHAALRHGQGRSRQDDRGRRARARGRRARAPHDRVRGRRAGPRVARVRARGRAARSRRCSSPRTCGRSRSTRRRRCSEWLGRQLGGGPALRLLAGSSRVPALRRRRARREGADHHRQGVGARPARALGRAQPHLRPRGRRRARLRPRRWRCSPRRTRSARSRASGRSGGRPFKVRDMLADPAAPATSRSRCPRRCR